MVAGVSRRERDTGKRDGELLSYLGRESFVAPVSWEHNPADWKLDGNGASYTHEGDPGWPVTCAGLGRLADEITVTTEDDGTPSSLGEILARR